jgi:hypothetical protein
MQEAMKNGSSRELKELQSRKMIKEIIDELGKNTEELRQAYSLASLDNNY